MPLSSILLSITSMTNSSMSGSSTAAAPPLPSSAYLVWEELTAVLPNSGICNGAHRHPKKLINGLTGYAVPGRILAVMGPSGSGKSTLLDSLAGRLAKNVVLTGNILLNGRKTSLNYGAVAYVTQENTLLNTLTVRETITYSAQLRLPARLTKQQVMAVVESTIDDMGLQDCADTVIGSWHVRGISGGEKKRLSIGLEILNQPSILFLDEPTSGLDSMSAFFVIQTLKQMALDGNKTIVASIHQPSSEVFAMLDDLYLLSVGETVYFGDINSATTFFEEAGFPCPSKRNPSDHFLRCINSDFDQVNTILNGSLKIRAINKEAESSSSSSDPLLKLRIGEIKTMLIESYRNSEYASTAIKQIQEISKIEGLTLEIRKGSHATWQKQLTTLTRRSFVNMSRDLGYYWARIVTYMFVALCVGSIYFNVGTTYTSIMARTACGGFVANFMTFMSIGGFPSFIEEMKVFYKERENGHYGVAVYILSNFLSSFPFLAAASITSGLVMYSMVKLRKGFEHYAFYTINLYSNIALIEGLMMVVASIVPNYLMGIITGAGIIGIMMTSSGFFRLLPDLPKPIFRYPVSYISYSAWSLQGEYKNDFIGLVFDPMVPGEPPITGEYVVEKMYGVSLKRSKWFDLSMILLLMLIYRLLFFVVLKFNERGRGPSFIRQIYARATLRTQKYEDSNNNNDDDNYIANTHSFRRSTGLSLSSRHQPLHPLALQEGLSSPLP